MRTRSGAGQDADQAGRGTGQGASGGSDRLIALAVARMLVRKSGALSDAATWLPG